MDAVFLAMGGILIPLGFYLKVERPEFDGIGTVAVLFGLVCWLLAYYFVKVKDKRERVERTNERQATQRLLEDIREELRTLNQGKK